MKILITGSGGLIGKEIAYQLSKNKKYDLNLKISTSLPSGNLLLAEGFVFATQSNLFKIKITVNLKHKFAERFFTNKNDRSGYLIFIAFCAICEAQIRNIEKVKDASLFRYRLNAICENLPPRS